jgi:hypothetical protein
MQNAPHGERKELQYKWRLAAAYEKKFILCGSKRSGADAGRWWCGGCPAFWLAGELRRCFGCKAAIKQEP